MNFHEIRECLLFGILTEFLIILNLFLKYYDVYFIFHTLHLRTIHAYPLSTFNCFLNHYITHMNIPEHGNCYAEKVAFRPQSHCSVAVLNYVPTKKTIKNNNSNKKNIQIKFLICHYRVWMVD